MLLEASETKEAVTIGYGLFIQTIIDFLIIGFVIFMVVKTYNTMQRKKDEAPAPPPAPSNEEKLLAEIRETIDHLG